MTANLNASENGESLELYPLIIEAAGIMGLDASTIKHQRLGEAAVFTAELDGNIPVVVRVGTINFEKTQKVYASYRGIRARLPHLLSSGPLKLKNGALLGFEVWERVGGIAASQVMLGKALVELEESVPPEWAPKYDPFTRAHPSRICFDESIVSRAVVEDLYWRAVQEWEAWCYRHGDTLAWVHGDWDGGNLLVCSDETYFILDVGDMGSGPVGVDAAFLLTQDLYAAHSVAGIRAGLSAWMERNRTGLTIPEIVAGLRYLTSYVRAARTGYVRDSVINPDAFADITSRRFLSLIAGDRGSWRGVDVLTADRKTAA